MPGFKPPTGDALTAQLKRVADYKSPGMYVMHPRHAAQAEELKQAAAASWAAPGGGSRASSRTASATPSPEPVQAPAPAPRAAQQQARATPQPGPAAAAMQLPKAKQEAAAKAGAEKGAKKKSGGVQQAAGKPRQRVTPEPNQARFELVEDALEIPVSGSRPVSAAAAGAAQQPKKSAPAGKAPAAVQAHMPPQRTNGPAKQVQAALKPAAKAKSTAKQGKAAPPKRKRLVRCPASF